VTAIILAAGVARRLAPLTDHTQKSLLPVGGRAILARMPRGAPRGRRAAGRDRGRHCADQVRALAASAPPGMTIQCVDNPAYQKGSALSLYCTRDVIVGSRRSSWTPTSCSRGSSCAGSWDRRRAGVPDRSGFCRYGRGSEDLSPRRPASSPGQEGGPRGLGPLSGPALKKPMPLPDAVPGRGTTFLPRAMTGLRGDRSSLPRPVSAKP